MKGLSSCGVNKEYVFICFSEKGKYDKIFSPLGLVKGDLIKVISLIEDDQLIIYTRNKRVAISGNVAKDILVVEKEDIEMKEYRVLSEILPGAEVIVESIMGKSALKRRLMDMGLTRGVTVILKKVAPLGDPIEISVRGYSLTLRKSEAKLILVKELEGDLFE